MRTSLLAASIASALLVYFVKPQTAAGINDGPISQCIATFKDDGPEQVVLGLCIMKGLDK